MKRRFLGSWIFMAMGIFLLVWLFPPGVSADPSISLDAPFVPGQLLVQFKSGVSAVARKQTRRSVQAIRQKRLKAFDGSSPVTPISGELELVTIPKNISVPEAIATFANDPAVEFAEPNWLRFARVSANDRYYRQGLLWGMYGDRTSPASLYGSQASEAWVNHQIGTQEVYVGIIDSGVQIDHPDLAANIWTNPYDPVDGLDNDSNGYTDDLHGWDVRQGNNTVYDGGTSGTTDQHGTHVAGTIGARGGNRIGVAGVNWNVTLIPCKFLGDDGGTTADAIECIHYLTDLKVRHHLAIVAINNSWGGGGFSQAELNAINQAGDAGILFVAAAGNGDDSGHPIDNDLVFDAPSGYQCTSQNTRPDDCVIAVAALTERGDLAYFSNYGATTVDLAAPGVAIYSTLPYNQYGALDGTSMAAPHVTGAIALYAASHRDPATGSIPDAATIRRAILESATPTPSLTGKTVTGGRLNVFEALSR
jgi:hypothetical protein